MATTETLREFLVALGFKVDDNSFSKFETSLGKATAGALELGGVVVTTALAIETAVASMARQFEDLFFQSQRTGSAVRAIQGFEYAARTVGVSADSARSAIEGLARAMRSNPGMSALLSSLGVRTQGRGSAEILPDLIDRLRRMPFYLAQQYGSMLGIDGDTLLMLFKNYDKFRASQADFARRQREAGVDPQRLAKDSHTFGNALRSLETTLSFIGDRILNDFLKPLTQAITIADHLARDFISLDRATNGWATTLGTLGTTALVAWIAKLLLARILFRSVATEAAAAAATAAAEAESLAAGAASRGILGRVVGGALGVLGGAAGFYFGSTTSTAASSIDSPMNDSKKRDSIIQFFVSQGWTREQATGIAANLYSESGFDPNSRGDNGAAYGIAQWHAARQKEFARVFGHSIQSSTLEEQLQFVQYELTKGSYRAAGAAIHRAGSAGAAAAAGSRFYEQPRAADEAANHRAMLARRWYDQSVGAGPGNAGSKHVVINSKTDVHVRSTDPKEAARETASQQGKVNADMVRYAGQTVR